MATYTIKGKQYTEFDINITCAELEGVNWQVCNDDEYTIYDTKTYDVFEPTECEVDTWPIIEKVWDELMGFINYDGEILTGMDDIDDIQGIKWGWIMQKHNCTKLVAACICFIEINTK